jgi:hypothetical protein
MPTREELHKLVDSMPKEAMRAAHQALSHFEAWPPAPPPDVQEMRKRMEERRLEVMQRQKPGTIAGFGGSADHNPATGSRSSSFNYWDGDTYVQETHRHHQGHQLKVVERIRAEGKHLIYKHEITGPGDKHDERETTFDIPQ